MSARFHRRVLLAARISLIANIVLLIAKIVACIFSKSISMISSTVDSSVDILSSLIAWWTTRSIQKLNIYKHPQGKTRLEPVGIIIVSCVMAVTSFQIMLESIKRMATTTDLVPLFSYYVLGIALGTTVTKLALLLYCYNIKSPTSKVLAQDHRNDVLTNIVVVLGLVLSRYLFQYADALGALLISIYVFANWFVTGRGHIGSIVGKTAPPEVLQLFTWACYFHDLKIKSIDTVRAYGFGAKFLIEADIELPADMPLMEAHNIGETLQQRLEALPEAERAFVHLDYEHTHHPSVEHKIGILF